MSQKRSRPQTARRKQPQARRLAMGWRRLRRLPMGRHLPSRPHPLSRANPPGEPSAAINPELFWASYLKPGTAAGMENGYWINFGSGWSHLHNDNPAEILIGASQKLFWEPAVAGGGDAGSSPAGQPGSTPPATTGQWKLVIQATKFVTHEVIEVWAGTKAGGTDPTGTYTRTSGLDPVATLTVEAVP